MVAACQGRPKGYLRLHRTRLGVYAIKVSNEIVDLSETLDTLSYRGRVVPEVNDPNVREVFIYSYRIIYDIAPTEIYVLAVIHGKRILSPEEIEERRE